MKNKKTPPQNQEEQERRSSRLQNDRIQDKRSFAERTPMDLTGRYSQDYLARQEDDGYHQDRMGSSTQNEDSDRRTDDTLCDEVCEALAQHPEVEDRHIHVEVQDGICTLTGWVTSDQMRRQAETCCRMVSGIGTIHNQLQLNHERRQTGFSSGSETHSVDR
ncbi:BON domain-containing protein [Pseudobdellovibrio exovorus]|uniref:BON domain-containing protein n=1 Tax=Pseudobdellovibrio exovorus JSS TaxID=1184267 RepID=M4V5X2_9BACT|nr:BON domain-containing protein [Pseudobdellovibrio exovorus]AGH94573.1 hypothetical protein A11Q_353 [Pseudobdellovibrio exovorus JSS]